MKLRTIILSTIAVGLVLLIAGTLIVDGWQRETKDRLPLEAMAKMVEGPISAVHKRGLAKGDATFERLVAVQRSSPGRVADLYMSYGVGLFNEWSGSDDTTLLKASRERIQASIPLYRAAFGPVHPEVALALNSFADVEIELNGLGSPPARIALQEALRIRRATLGATNAETLATEARLECIDRRGREARRYRRTDAGAVLANMC